MSFKEYSKLRTKFISTLPDTLNKQELVWVLMGHYLAYRGKINNQRKE